MKHSAILTVVSVLIPCASMANNSWRVNKSVDEMTDAVSINATVTGDHGHVLLAGCSKGKKTLVLVIEDASVDAEDISGLDIRFRVDKNDQKVCMSLVLMSSHAIALCDSIEQPPNEPDASTGAPLVRVGAATDVLGEFEAGNSVLFAIPISGQGPIYERFSLKGSRNAFRQAFAGCSENNE